MGEQEERQASLGESVGTSPSCTATENPPPPPRLTFASFILVQRGSTTGIDHNPTLNWRSQQRTRFVAYTNSVSSPSNSTTLLAPTVEGDTGKVRFRKLTLGQADLAEWKDWAFDVAFSGKAIQCEGKQGNKHGVGATGTCKELRLVLVNRP